MQQVLARKNVQKATFEAAEMILGPSNQQLRLSGPNGIRAEIKAIKIIMGKFQSYTVHTKIYVI